MIKENIESGEETEGYNILDEQEETKHGESNEILYVDNAPFLESPYYLGDFRELGTMNSSKKSSSKQINKSKPSAKPIKKSLGVAYRKVLSAKDLKNDVENPKKAVGGKFLKYQCRFCKKNFKQCAALGGHISKAHPGQSMAYNHKKQVREQRELERLLHKDAMEFYFKKFNKKGESHKILNRNTIKSIKKMMVNTKPEYKQLKDKFLGRNKSANPD